ncbi:MAG: hypothetical protein R3E58_00080 [Phycisphaerae bacterium]|nr:hypothetical protein [Phycisphaerales bacterium]
MKKVFGFQILWVLVLGLPLSLWAHPGAHHDIERVSRLIEAEPERAELWVERAHHRRLAGEYDAALEDLNQAERLAPGNWDVSAHRGLTLARMGKGQEAEIELTRFLEHTSGTAAAFVERARIRHASGRVEAGISDLTASLELSRDIGVYLQRGAWQESLERWDDAANGYQEALEFFGSLGSLQRAQIRVELARGNRDKALSIVDSAIATARSKVPWLLQRAAVLDAMEKFDEARRERLAALDEINRILQKKITAIQLVLRAEVYIALNQAADARRDLELVLKNSPNYYPAQELLSKLDGQTH